MKFGDTDGFGFTLGFAVLHTLTFIYDVVTFPIYCIIQNPLKTLRRAKQIQAIVTAQDDTSITFSSQRKPNKFYHQLVNKNIDTMDQVLLYCKEKYGDKKCLGTRTILEEVDEVQSNGKTFKKYVMGDYVWRSYKQFEEEARLFGLGLREIGVNERENVVIFCETRAEWMIAAHGFFKQNFTLVTIYATLGDDGIIHAINETEVSTVVTSSDLLPKLKNLLQKLPNVRKIVYIEDQLKQFEKNETKTEQNGVQIFTYNDILMKGVDSKLDTLVPIPEDTAIIMYTSGSTGVPKGVILTHKNLVATMKGFCNATNVNEKDIMMSFLPLAHVFELLVENMLIFMGVRLGYSTPLTMLDTSSKIQKGTKGDASVLRPTFITSVPLIMDRIASGVKEKVSKETLLVRILFNFFYQYKLKWHRRGFSTPLINRIIFGKSRQLIGGRLRFIIVGGAPLTAETQELVKTSLCLVLSQGYGLTETTSSTSVQDFYDTTYGRVGAPMTGIDVRLVNWEEGNYTVKDKPYPRGEIVIGGDNVSVGYYKLPEKTKEDFYLEGNKRWFKTGDIGEIHGDGVLKIIDRKKDILKLQMGEYISLGKIESILKNHPYVENICICGDSTRNYCVGLVALQRDKIMPLKTITSSNKSFEEMCDDKIVIKTVLKELTDYGKQCKLSKFEIPAAIKLVKEEWLPETGLITTSFKLKRKDIQEYYKDDIQKLY